MSFRKSDLVCTCILFARLHLKNINLEGNIHIISVNNVVVNERNTNFSATSCITYYMHSSHVVAKSNEKDKSYNPNIRLHGLRYKCSVNDG